jgi:hypothetical protein
VCLECLRTCPLDNVAIRLRPMGADLRPSAPVRIDEAFKSLVLIGSALVYAFVLLGPSSALRAAAAAVGSPSWLAYAAGFLLVTVVLVPGLFLAATQLGHLTGRPRLSAQECLRRFAPALIPLGLAAWMAFSLGFVLTNASYILPVLSDPIGLGWDLLGTTSMPWIPVGGPLVSWVLAAIVLVGLAWSSRHVRAIAEDLAGGVRLALPVWGFSFLVTAGLLWVFVA